MVVGGTDMGIDCGGGGEGYGKARAEHSQGDWGGVWQAGPGPQKENLSQQ